MPQFYDRPLTMPTAYNMGDPTSQSYFDTAAKRHEASMRPAYEKALDDTRSSWTARGFGGSGGMERMAEMGLTQDYLGQMGDYRGKLAQRASDIAEENRRRVESRGWQVEDRDLRYQKLREQEQRQREDAEAAKQSEAWKSVGRGVGTVAGGIVGFYAGGLAGAMAGADLGSQLLGGGSSGSYQGSPSPYQFGDQMGSENDDFYLDTDEDADYQTWLLMQNDPYFQNQMAASAAAGRS